MRHLNFLDEAEDDLIDIARYIAEKSGSIKTALDYTDKIRAHCKQLAEFPGVRGSERPELKENLRSIPFENYIIFF